MAHAIFGPKGLGILILALSSRIKINQQKKPLSVLRAFAVQISKPARRQDAHVARYATSKQNVPVIHSTTKR
jgi:hypothetical protein